MREVGPTKINLDTKVIESYISTAKSKIGASTKFKKWAYHFLLPIGYKVAEMKLSGKKINLFWSIAFQIGEFLMFRPIKDCGGAFRSADYISISGNSIAIENIMFLRALGMNVRFVKR
jgi:long-chain acyl-CoA synthetase